MAVDIKGYIKRSLLLGVELRPGELLGVMAMFGSLFLILFTAYLLKPAREMLILTEGTAEIRSYAVALQALLLLHCRVSDWRLVAEPSSGLDWPVPGSVPGHLE